MENPLHSKKSIPNYVLVSIALVQSEIFWFYSVLYYIFRESGLVVEHNNNTTAMMRRNRSHSAPPTSTSFTRKNFVTLDDIIIEEEEEEHEEENQIQRRYSLPIDRSNINIRGKPSVEDELVGTTCPPVMWQKLRVKLGRAPVHGDPKPRSIHSISPPSSPSPPELKSSSTSLDSSIKQIDSTSPTISARSATDSLYLSPDSCSSPFSLSKTSIKSNIEEEASSISSISTQQKKSTKKKIISKLNSAFHLHRRISSTNLSKTHTL